MRRLRRLGVLGAFTVLCTFSPPYPSNANFPSQRPVQPNTSGVSTNSTGDSATTTSYDIRHR